MNHICERDNVKKLPATRLTEILVSEGYIVEKQQEGRFAKAPTEKGIEEGIKEIDKVSEKGNAYTLLVYPEKIQRMLVEQYIREEIVEEK